MNIYPEAVKGINGNSQITHKQHIRYTSKHKYSPIPNNCKKYFFLIERISRLLTTNIDNKH
jgi:hypothetical protein